MGVTWHSDADCDKTLGPIAKRLRLDSESVTREALPTRWLDLILYLDAQERAAAAGSQPGEHAGLTEAERAVGNQENVLQELMRTEEPTAQTAALLEDLRQKVARAVAERH